MVNLLMFVLSKKEHNLVIMYSVEIVSNQEHSINYFPIGDQWLIILLQ